MFLRLNFSEPLKIVTYFTSRIDTLDNLNLINLTHASKVLVLEVKNRRINIFRFPVQFFSFYAYRIPDIELKPGYMYRIPDYGLQLLFIADYFRQEMFMLK